MYLVMDYLEGVTLGILLRCQRKGEHFSVKTLQFWFGQLASALEHLHRLGIIHRDVKSDNIWISMEGHLRLMDFGLSKIVNDDHQEMPPEQEELDLKFDINIPTMRILPDECRKLLMGLWPANKGKEEGADTSSISCTDYISPFSPTSKDEKSSSIPKDEGDPVAVEGVDITLNTTAPTLSILTVDPDSFHVRPYVGPSSYSFFFVSVFWAKLLLLLMLSIVVFMLVLQVHF